MKKITEKTTAKELEQIYTEVIENEDYYEVVDMLIEILQHKNTTEDIYKDLKYREDYNKFIFLSKYATTEDLEEYVYNTDKLEVVAMRYYTTEFLTHQNMTSDILLEIADTQDEDLLDEIFNTLRQEAKEILIKKISN